MTQEVLYNVAYDRAYYHAPINPDFDVAMVLKRREEQIRNNILYYLGEFHLGLSSGEFFYREERYSKTGQSHLAAYEPGPVRSQFKNGVWAKRAEGSIAQREVAEYMGFKRLEKELLASPDNTLFLWVSPAIAPHHHSITFAGQIIPDGESRERKVRVIANRNMHSIGEHRAYMEKFTEQARHFVLDVDFLGHPTIFAPTEAIESPEDMLTVTGIAEKIDTSWKSRLTRVINPFLSGYLALIKSETSDEELRISNLQNVLLAFERYVTGMKREIYASSN